MTSHDYAKAYRPQRFEDVIGQNHPVEYLSGIIRRGQKGRAILLHGDYGSSKTTLARIYAMALNCEEPTPSGSPCLACDRCLLKGYLRGLQTFNHDGSHDLPAWVSELNRTPTGECKWRVLFIDEAHLLSDREMDVILQATEEPQPFVIFCLATTEPSRLRAPLRSRFQPLEVRALPIDMAVELLRRIADQEGLSYDLDALVLLAGFKAGHPRDLLTGLQQVGADGEKITLERVRFVFDIDHGAVLIPYLEALAEGDLALQTKTIFSWREPTPTKPRWIQACLTGIYYNEILQMPLILDGVIGSIAPGFKQIVQAFCRRLELQHPSALRPAWIKMMDFWQILGQDLDDAAVHLRLTLFHHFVNEELPHLIDPMDRSWSQISTGSQAANPVVSLDADTGRGEIRGNPFPTPDWLSADPDDDPAFLQIEDVREVINCASFLTQEYALTFNVAIDICPLRYGCETERDGRNLIDCFLRELEAQIPKWRGDDRDLVAFLVRFYRAELGVEARIVAHLPRSINENSSSADCVRAAQDWATHWRSELRTDATDRPLRFDIGGRGKVASLKFHWEKTSRLCVGLSRRDLDTSSSSGNIPLWKALGLGRFEEPLTRVEPPLIVVSEDLSPPAIEIASRSRMDPLSAFDARAWGYLYSGWERAEHTDRKRSKKERSDRVRTVRASHDPGSEDERQALEQLARQWPSRPEDRDRGWRGWWTALEG